MASMGHGWVVLEMSVLVLRHCRGEAAVSAPVGVWIYGRTETGSAKSQVPLQLKRDKTSDSLEAGGETHWRVQR